MVFRPHPAVDPDRFDRLFAEHFAAVVAYAERRSSGEIADDVAAETFAVAWRKLSDVPEEALPWLLAVARRVLANQRRSDSRRASLVERLESEPQLARPTTELSLQWTRALLRLNEREREAVLLVAWEQLTPAQAAVVAGCSATAMRLRLMRARRRLQAALSADVPVCTTKPQRSVTNDA